MIVREQHNDKEDWVDEQAFERVFKSHFKALHAYGLAIVKDSAAAEEIVQTVFLKLWEKRTTLNITVSLKAYLYKAVYHESINHLKHEKVRMKHSEHHLYISREEAPVESMAFQEEGNEELSERLTKALDQLPEKCRMVFYLSRFEELKYKDIADRLGISIKTVEAHMGKALKTLRLQLADYIPFILMLMLSYILWR
ncbi:MAG TPA: RNA polymerase sigma-70 factor [Cyclobacteriaceae bacterium]|nr:RNA polymerase sigma-70 factor [Cyclobacteriaceae bacterium]